MGREYAGILGTTAFVTVIFRGILQFGSLESMIPTAVGAMFLFAAVGWFVGSAAARIVDESVHQRINEQLESLAAENEATASGK